MSTRTKTFACLLFLLIVVACDTSSRSDPHIGGVDVAAPEKWPTRAWEKSSPEAQGVSSNALAEALEFALANDINIHSLTVVRNGVLILDAYFYPFEPEVRHDVASVTKSIVSLLAGAAIADGHLEGLEQPIISSLPTVSIGQVDERVTQIRIGDLLSMQSGLDCGFKAGEPELAAMSQTSDWAAYAIHLPIVAKPGTRFGYCSPNYHLVSAAIATAVDLDVLDYARKRLFSPLGIDDLHWSADPMGYRYGWGDLQLRPRDMAKIGLLMLRSGRWEDRQIVPEKWVRSSLSAANEKQDYGLGWWLHRSPPTFFEAVGRGGQRITVLPDKNAIVVMTGGGFEPGDIGAFLLEAVSADTVLPADPSGQARLADALRRIALSPPAREVTQHVSAKHVSQREYALANNALGYQSFAIEFLDSAQAVLHLRLVNGEQLVQPLGLDGRYRVTNDRNGAVLAGRAEWLPGGTLRVEYNRLSLINRYFMDIEFRGDEVHTVITESTQLGTAELHGHAVELSR